MIVVKYEPGMMHEEGEWLDDESMGHGYSIEFNFDWNHRDECGDLTLDDREGNIRELLPSKLRRWAGMLNEYAATVEKADLPPTEE